MKPDQMIDAKSPRDLRDRLQKLNLTHEPEERMKLRAWFHKNKIPVFVQNTCYWLLQEGTNSSEIHTHLDKMNELRETLKQEQQWMKDHDLFVGYDRHSQGFVVTGNVSLKEINQNDVQEEENKV